MPKSLEPDIFLPRSREGVVIDVRTPAEFVCGHIPGAANLPLFTDAQRAEVGTLYVRTGRKEAILKGLEFVGPKLSDMVRRAEEIAQGREVFLYCWRGGMRSASVAWLLSTAGMKVSLLEGGYKAYRRSFDGLLTSHNWRFKILCGPTGCGKTELLERIAGKGEQVLDLEGIACHKGSVFGGLGQQPQPTTEHFINLLHERFRSFTPDRAIWCEGESMLVGHVFIPQPLFGMMRSDVVVEVNMDRDQRLDRLVSEYGAFSTQELSGAFCKITKRMGGDRVAAALKALDAGDVRTAAQIALGYYDRAYTTATTEPAVRFTVCNDDMERSAAQLISLTK